MKSKTSFFNLTLLKKNLVRFSPIWITYLVLYVLSGPMLIAMNVMDGNPEWTDIARSMVSATTQIGLFVAFVYGALIAMAVFSYLFHARSVSLMHALPITRGGLFLTNYVSGLLFILVPNAIAALLTAFVSSSGILICGNAIFTMFLTLCAMEIFFYSFAVFIAMFTGHILALPVFYAIYNFVLFVLKQTIDSFVSPLMYGVTGLRDDLGLITWLTPVVKMARGLDVAVYKNRVFLIGAYILVVYVIAGAVLAILSYLAYRARPSETAGEVVTVPWARVVFRYGVGITAGFTIGQGIYMLLFRGSVFSGIVSELLCMLIMAAVGYFIAQMLLNKSFRVFRKSLHGSALCMTFILLVFACALFDVTGATRRIPNVENIRSVSVDVGINYAGDYSSAVLTEEENVKDVLAFHSYMLEHRAEGTLWQIDDLYTDVYYYNGDEFSGKVTLNYYLKDGTSVHRYYRVKFTDQEWDENGSIAYLLRQIVESKEYRARNSLGELYMPPTDTTLTFTEATYDYIGSNGEWQTRTLSAEQIDRLYEALLKDAKDGVLPAPSLGRFNGDDVPSNYVNSINIYYSLRNQDTNETSKTWQSVAISPQMNATVQVLKDMQIIDDSAPLMTEEEANRLWGKLEQIAETTYAGPIAEAYN